MLPTTRSGFAPYPHPNPSSVGEGLCSLLPPGEGAPEGADEGPSEASHPKPLHPNLSRSDATTGKMPGWMSLICSIT
ncbi:hypothetical protein EIQ28_14995 [Xanthomonas campestris pv. plantaginis]